MCTTITSTPVDNVNYQSYLPDGQDGYYTTYTVVQAGENSTVVTQKGKTVTTQHLYRTVSRTLLPGSALCYYRSAGDLVLQPDTSACEALGLYI